MRMVAAARAVPRIRARDDQHPEIAQRVFGKRNPLHRRRPRPPERRVEHHHGCQPEVGRGQAEDGDRAPRVVGGGILAHCRVDADRQGQGQPDEDCQHTELDGYRQPVEDPRCHRNTAANQGVAEAAVQEDASDPACILHVDRHIQAEHVLERCTVHLRGHEFGLAQHRVYGIAGDEAHREKHQHTQDEQGRDDQQQPPDDVRSHILVANGRRETLLGAPGARRWSRSANFRISRPAGRSSQKPISVFSALSIQRRANITSVFPHPKPPSSSPL